MLYYQLSQTQELIRTTLQHLNEVSREFGSRDFLSIILVNTETRNVNDFEFVQETERMVGNYVRSSSFFKGLLRNEVDSYIRNLAKAVVIEAVSQGQGTVGQLRFPRG
jgi:hypothetical protein